MTQTAHGIDISKHQSTFRPETAMAAGVHTVILRAAYGAQVMAMRTELEEVYPDAF